MQDTTLEVRRWYSKENLCTSNPVSLEPDDFIATELEFAAYLLARAHEYYQQNCTAQATEYINLYNDFWQGHLGIWLPWFVKAISSSSSTHIFKVLGEILLQAVIPIQQGKGGLS
jgi:TorA maturation chaperone TorD